MRSRIPSHLRRIPRNGVSSESGNIFLPRYEKILLKEVEIG